jgi:hypothetical protein
VSQLAVTSNSIIFCQTKVRVIFSFLAIFYFDKVFHKPGIDKNVKL